MLGRVFLTILVGLASVAAEGLPGTLLARVTDPSAREVFSVLVDQMQRVELKVAAAEEGRHDADERIEALLVKVAHLEERLNEQGRDVDDVIFAGVRSRKQ